MQRRKKDWTRKRPIAVTIVAWGILVLSIVRLVQAIRPLMQMGIFEEGLAGPFIDGLGLTPQGLALLTGTIYSLASVVSIVVLIGFLRLRRWAWVILMTWTAASLTIGLIDYFYGDPNYIVMASNVVIALALNQVDVQRIFQIRIEQDERRPRPG